MGLKTAGYMLFTAGCLAGAAVLGYRGIGNDSSSAAPGPVTLPSAPTPAAVAPPPAVVVPKLPLAISGEVYAAAVEKLGPPREMTGGLFPGLAEPKQLAPRRKTSAMDRPALPPAAVRREPAGMSLPRACLPVRGLKEELPLAMGDAPMPERPAMATGPRLVVETPVPPLPMLRLALVNKPPQEPGTSQSMPVLDAQGGATMPVLPPARTQAAPPARGTDEARGEAFVLPALGDAMEPPVGTRALVERAGMK